MNFIQTINLLKLLQYMNIQWYLRLSYTILLPEVLLFACFSAISLRHNAKRSLSSSVSKASRVRTRVLCFNIEYTLRPYTGIIFAWNTVWVAAVRFLGKISFLSTNSVEIPHPRSSIKLSIYSGSSDGMSRFRTILTSSRIKQTISKEFFGN